MNLLHYEGIQYIFVTETNIQTKYHPYTFEIYILWHFIILNSFHYKQYTFYPAISHLLCKLKVYKYAVLFYLHTMKISIIYVGI
jgi:hypothetical protein